MLVMAMARWMAMTAMMAAGCGLYVGDGGGDGPDAGIAGADARSRPDAGRPDARTDARPDARADAMPAGLRVLVVGGWRSTDEADMLRGAALADPRVAIADEWIVQWSDVDPPTLADLAAYDAVVFFWNDEIALDDSERVAYGNRLADFVDAGGGLVTVAYAQGSSSLLGRLLSAGYLPLRPPVAPPYKIFAADRVETAGNGDPLLAGAVPITAGVHPVSLVDPQAVLVASWRDGQPAVARKGRVISLGVRLDPTDVGLGGGWQALLDNAIAEVGR